MRGFDTRGWFALGGLLLLAIAVLLLLFVGNLAEADDRPGTRAPGDFQGAQYCATSGCHPSLFNTWNQTRHAGAWDDLIVDPNYTDSCEVCHTTGAGDEAHNGFNITTDQPDYLKAVQCEACHGPDPHTDPMTAAARVNYSASICGTCHNRDVGTVHHPYLNEWQDSRHSQSLLAADGAVVQDPSCRGCHVAEAIVVENFGGGTLTGPLTNPQPITCAVCHDPHGSVYPNSLRLPPAQLCASCHSPTATRPGEEVQHPQAYMREGLSGLDLPQISWMVDVTCADCHLFSSQVDVNVSKTGHTFRPSPEACVACHDGVQALPKYTWGQADALIRTWQDQTRRIKDDVELALFQAEQAMDGALALGFTPAQIDTALEAYEEANYSVTFVIEDQSGGVHNPPFAEDLLTHALARAQFATTFLQPGTVTGRLLDESGTPVAGAVLMRLGRVYGVSDSDGRFAFDHAYGTFSFEVLIGTRSLGTLTGVVIVAGEETALGDVTVSPQVEPDYVPWLLALLAIVVAAVVVAWALLRRPRQEPPEGEEEG